MYPYYKTTGRRFPIFKIQITKSDPNWLKTMSSGWYQSQGFEEIPTDG